MNALPTTLRDLGLWSAADGGPCSLPLMAAAGSVDSGADLNVVSSLAARDCRMTRRALNGLAAGHECPAYNSKSLKVWRSG